MLRHERHTQDIRWVVVFVALFIFWCAKGELMNGSKTEAFTLRMTPAEAAALRAVANERSCSVGAVMRWAIKSAVIGDPPSGRGKRSGESAKVLESGGATPLVQS